MALEARQRNTGKSEGFKFAIAAGVATTASGAVGSKVYARGASTMAAVEEVPLGTDSLPIIDLYQYSVCPWCNKLRAFLDYHQLPYRIHEVNPLSKKEIKFSEYKKVPIVVFDGVQMNDSAEIITKLGEAMAASGNPAYRATAIGEGASPGGVSPAKMEELSIWAGEDLVRALTCSIYRTPGESMQAMQYIISHPEFSWLEKQTNQYIGSAIMYLVSKRMKGKYNIEDERQSVYKACSTWVTEVGDRKFLGGDAPCRVDLEVFGYLRAVRDMDTFGDALKHTRLGPWFRHMEEVMPAANLQPGLMDSDGRVD